MKNLKPLPISFTAENVLAVLDGRKTHTRRIISSNPNEIRWNAVSLNGYAGYTDEHGNPVPLKYGEGRELWVQEGYEITAVHDDQALVGGYYLADRSKFGYIELDSKEWNKFTKRKHPYRPSPGRFMYKSLSRIKLVVVREWFERIQDISEVDAQREGWNWEEHDLKDRYDPVTMTKARDWFTGLWDSINKKRGYDWNSNPLVRCVEFEVKEVKS